jgi:hypothetical protein
VTVVGIYGTVAIVEHLGQSADRESKVAVVVERRQQAYVPTGLCNLFLERNGYRIVTVIGRDGPVIPGEYREAG